MKKKLTGLLAILLAASMALGGCSGNTETQSADPSSEGGTTEQAESEENKHEITNLVLPKTATRELQTFNILYSQLAADFENLCNLTDPLLEVDTYGELAPAIAEEWGTEDGGLTWTFHLREGFKWVDMNANEKADCVARDFATSLVWVLYFYKNDSANTTMPLEMIEGAEEYYEWTKTLSQEEAYALDASDGSTFMEMVGIEIPDDYTVIYHCVAPKPYFDSVATYACLYPLAQGLVDELGVDGV